MCCTHQDSATVEALVVVALRMDPGKAKQLRDYAMEKRN